MTEPTIYNIYWHSGYGRDYVATTNNLEKWLEENNSLREGEGSEPECLDDFVIEEADSYIYKNEGVRRYFYDGKEVN